MKMHLSEHKVLPNAAARTKFSAFWQSIANLTDKAGYTWRATLLTDRSPCGDLFSLRYLLLITDLGAL